MNESEKAGLRSTLLLYGYMGSSEETLAWIGTLDPEQREYVEQYIFELSATISAVVRQVALSYACAAEEASKSLAACAEQLRIAYSTRAN